MLDRGALTATAPRHKSAKPAPMIWDPIEGGWIRLKGEAQPEPVPLTGSDTTLIVGKYGDVPDVLGPRLACRRCTRHLHWSIKSEETP